MVVHEKIVANYGSHLGEIRVRVYYPVVACELAAALEKVVLKNVVVAGEHESRLALVGDVAVCDAHADSGY